MTHGDNKYPVILKTSSLGNNQYQVAYQVM